MKKIIYLLAALVIVPAFIYFWFAIGNADFDIRKWSANVRSLFAMLGFLLSAASCAFINNEIDQY